MASRNASDDNEPAGSQAVLIAIDGEPFTDDASSSLARDPHEDDGGEG